MFMIQKMHALAAGGSDGASYVANAVDFDGVNDYLTRGAGLTGAADSSTGIFSAWLRFDGDNGSTVVLLQETSATYVSITRNGAYRIDVTLRNSGASNRFTYRTNLTYPNSATWRHILTSWDTNFAAGAKVRHLYISDVVDAAGLIVDADAAFNVDYTHADWSVGGTTGGASLLDACMAEVYFAPGQFLDFSNSANRRKFISGTGKPVSLGADGSLPTGTAPLVYLKGDNTAFNVNSGTGGNFALTGSLTAASTSPSS